MSLSHWFNIYIDRVLKAIRFKTRKPELTQTTAQLK